MTHTGAPKPNWRPSRRKREIQRSLTRAPAIGSNMENLTEGEIQMKNTRRESGKVVEPRSVPAMPATTATTPPEGETLKYDRWITDERFSVFEHGENCWHPQLV